MYRETFSEAPIDLFSGKLVFAAGLPHNLRCVRGSNTAERIRRVYSIL